MKACDYCGRRSDDTAQFCAECGQTLTAVGNSLTEPPATQPAPRTLAGPGTLNARSATIILLFSLGVEVCGAVVAVIVTISRTSSVQEASAVARQVADWIQPFMAPLIGLVTIIMSARLVPNYLHDPTPEGAAWLRGSRRAIAQGLLMGLMMGACARIFVSSVRPHLNHRVSYASPVPSEGIAHSSGVLQLLWLVSVSLVAPVSEELLFRSVLYGGFRKSFGSMWAAILTTLIFWALHLPTPIRDPFVSLGLTSFSLGAVWIRLRSRAIGPAIAAHVGYNTSLCLDLISRLIWKA